MSSWPQTPAQCTVPWVQRSAAPARARLGSGQLSPGEGGELCLLPDPCGACRRGHLSSRQTVPALTLVGSLQRHRQMGSKDPWASRLCRRGPALHNPGRALPPLSLSSLGVVFAGGPGCRQSPPTAGCGARERVGQAPLITSLPRTGNRPMGLAGTYRARGQPAPRQAPEESVEAFLLFKNIPTSLRYMRVAGGGGAEKKEGEREGEGEGRPGIAGARSLSAPSPLLSSCSPGSSGGSRTWPSAAGGGRPPSGRGGPLQGPTTDCPSSTACSSPRSRSTVRTHSLQTPSRGGRAGLSLPAEPAAPGPPWAAHTFSAPARESPTLLTDPSPQTVGPDGDGSHGPTLSEAPQ